jgi:hypothetical protein
MPTEAAPGSSGHACRVEPAAPDTLRAMPMFVPRPSAAQGTAFAGAHRMFPRRSDGCAACTDTPQWLDSLWDYRRPYPDKDVEAPRLLARASRQQWLREASRVTGSRGPWRPPWPAQVDRPRLPRQGGVSPLVPMVGGMPAHHVPAHTGFAHRGVGGLPWPVDPAQLVPGWSKNSPQPFVEAQLTPALAVPMPGAVGATLRGQWVP